MHERYIVLFQSLINKIQDAERRWDLAQGKEDLELAYCKGIQFGLDILKEERFENTGFFKKLEEKSSNIAGWVDPMQDRIFMDTGMEIDFLWDKLHELAKSCANEDRRSVATKTIEFDPKI